MADETFAVHQYLRATFRVGKPEGPSISVSRTNRKDEAVSLGLSEGSFHWFDALTVAQAVELGQALLFAAADADAQVPVTKSMGPMQLMVRRATGGLFDVAKGGAT